MSKNNRSNFAFSINSNHNILIGIASKHTKIEDLNISRNTKKIRLRIVSTFYYEGNR